jgi:hypothetical protein
MFSLQESESKGQSKVVFPDKGVLKPGDQHTTWESIKEVRVRCEDGFTKKGDISLYYDVDKIKEGHIGLYLPLETIAGILNQVGLEIVEKK